MSTTQAGWPRVRFDFAGLDVLVTGGTKGIGKAIACAFRDAGARVTITGGAAHERDYDELPAGVRYRQLRLTERSDIEALATAVTALDVLVNNAGGTGGASSPYDFDTALTVNLGAVYHLSEALADVLSLSLIHISEPTRPY